eukprot:4097439-Amphidinium_carterae.1
MPHALRHLRQIDVICGQRYMSRITCTGTLSIVPVPGDPTKLSCILWCQTVRNAVTSGKAPSWGAASPGRVRHSLPSPAGRFGTACITGTPCFYFKGAKRCVRITEPP